jgi:poly-gamma-glutamate capsule biosynthesis protein CapA/YwtB (metallophosphatase superfamily)
MTARRDRDNGHMVGQHAASDTHARRPIGGIILGVTAALVGVVAGVAFAQSQPDARATVGAEPSAPSGGQATTGPTKAPDLGAVAPPIPTVPTVTFSLVAAGDVLTHGPVMDSARSGGSYDFGPLFAPSSPFVAAGDIALCHLEVPVAPPGTAPSGYPMFGAPASIVGDLGDAGWDGCSTASNHSVDRAFSGIEATLDEFENEGLGHTGTARSEHEAAQVQFYNVVEGDRTVKVAHISYTYGLNGLPKPAGKPWSVNVFNASGADVSPIIDAAQDARDKGADVVVASVHCCVEYQTQPTDTQRSIVAQIAESGLVDLYVGHHAHVPQPIARIDGGPGDTGMWAAYGLGNFISNQALENVGHAETSNGLLITATFSVSPSDDVEVDVAWTAITVDRAGKHTVYPITESTGAVGTLSASVVKARWQLVADAVGDQVAELTSPGEPSADFVWSTARSR